MTISIITTVLNNVNTVDDCLSSIHGQRVQPFEHIIIDAGSTDGTLERIRERKKEYTRIFSEPDDGIYHGMNKGLALATGDVVGTLNADDMYYDTDVLAKVAKVFEDERVDSCYGDLVYIATDNKGIRSTVYGIKERYKVQGIGCTVQGVRDKERYTVNGLWYTDEKVVRYWKSGAYDPRKFYWGWMVPHPTFFVRRHVFEKYGIFNTDLGTAADYELMLRFLVKYEISAHYIPEVLIRMRVGGISNASIVNRLKANRMDRRAWQVNGLRPFPWTLWMKPFRKIGQWAIKKV